MQVFFYRSGRNYGNRAYYPAHAKDAALGEIAGGVPRPSSTPSGSPPRLVLLAEPVPEQALLAEALSVRAGRKVELLVPQAGRAAPAGRERADQCPPGAGAPAGRHGQPGGAAGAAGRTVRAAGRAGADRGLRQQPHPGQQRDRCVHRRRPRRFRQEKLPHLQHQGQRPCAGRRLRHDARGAAAPVRAPDQARIRSGPAPAGRTWW